MPKSVPILLPGCAPEDTRSFSERWAALAAFKRLTRQISRTRRTRRSVNLNGLGPKATLAALVLAVVSTAGNTFTWWGGREKSQGSLEQNVSSLNSQFVNLNGRVDELDNRLSQSEKAIIKLDSTLSNGFERLDRSVNQLTEATREIGSELQRTRRHRGIGPRSSIRVAKETTEDQLAALRHFRAPGANLYDQYTLR